ncbi:MAG: DUF362 domain-containing protein [Caldithrix sp.]|nr:DUF362 domain-containing protein [Caldithrix sp.]
MTDAFVSSRRNFLKTSGALSAGALLGQPTLWADDRKKAKKPAKPKTNVKEALQQPVGRLALPGVAPGKVVEVENSAVKKNDAIDKPVLNEMFLSGLQALTAKNAQQYAARWFTKGDIIGIKVNPVGAGLINTHLELVDIVIDWLTANGIKREQIIIWDRFDYMLADAGFTPDRFPGVGIEGLQTMDEKAIDNKTKDTSRWMDDSGKHISLPNFDQEVYYWADVDGPQDVNYLNQHVVNSKYSYFGKLLTKRLTKIINIPVFKNTGNGVSMATKNMGYAVICNTGRLHRPLFFDVCTEVLAFPVIRNKLVLNIIDGIRGQYDGGPGANAKFIYPLNKLYLATDPFALDRVGHEHMVQKRLAMNVRVNQHPRFTEYLRYAQRLGLGIGELQKIDHTYIKQS